ncbi:MAG TPA: DUF2244 domain-containing protein, partial [Steroidobacteraceae bacterium]|nr:DUF2244 domain-containing protein [Steroidobacteraceae bacterium]
MRAAYRRHALSSGAADAYIRASHAYPGIARPADMVVSTVEAGPVAFEYRIELSPNCSLTPATARRFVGSLALLTLGTALFFTWRGFWPVLPFAGLEIGLLWWAVRASMRAGARREVILISDDSVVLERRWPANTSRLVFARHWATVK